MFLIVTATFLAGLLTTKLLMMSGVDLLWLRYAIAVGAAYLTFLAIIRLWIWYVCNDGEVDPSDAFDLFEIEGSDLSGGAPFAAGGSDKSGGFSFDIAGDEGCFVVILLAILIGVLFIAGGYLIYAAPAILGEAVFEALLAAALVRRTKKLAAAGWAGSIFRATVWIFLAVLAISVLLGWYAQKSCPEARRIRDAIHCRSVGSEQ